MNTTYVGTAIPRNGRSLLKGALERVRCALDTVLTWQERERQRRQLMALDDRLLADLGMTRADAVGEYRKPFWRP
jgi:uncharacterized protein YjiS (DUF1127 family)